MSRARASERTVTQIRTVQVIPPTAQAQGDCPNQSVRPKRVAAYARVSTSSEEQLTSYEAQVAHYTSYIKSREATDNWQFVEVYTDRGISGVSTKKREGFNRMIEDALSGKIDLIITKSVSRFARNTVDTLTTIRKLKEHGVEVYFEEQSIYTMDGRGELLLTIMSSIAQEESRNISENVTWGLRKRFADGKVCMPYKQFMGYRRGLDGVPEVVKSEADIVRTIYRRYLEGATPAVIARELNESGIPCPSHKGLLKHEDGDIPARWKDSTWNFKTIENMLLNEKYKGDAILQKTYCTDYILKTFVSNDGSVVPKYYAANSHPAIVSGEVFNLVQSERTWRQSLHGRYSAKNWLASRMVCGECGAFYGRKTLSSTSKYRHIAWQCNDRFTGETRRHAPSVTQAAVEKAFCEALKQLLSEKEDIDAVCREALHSVLKPASSGRAGAEGKLMPDDRKKRDRSRIDEVLDEEVPFTPSLFVALVDRVVIERDGRMVFVFRNGEECASGN